MTKKPLAALVAVLLIVAFSAQPTFAYSESTVLKQGMRTNDVAQLQHDLLDLGYFADNPTGYFGGVTKTALVNFQVRNGLLSDGVAGADTFKKIASLKNSGSGSVPGSASNQGSVPGLVPSSDLTLEGLSRSRTTFNELADKKEIERMPWFGEVSGIYGKGDVATVTDVETGLSMQIMRTGGTNHADVETINARETEKLMKVAGGDWNWTRRPVIVEIDGYRIAASMTCRPHAGRDDMPAHDTVSNRSGGYGRGTNWDSVKGNNMDGHFDIHFYGSRTHGSNRTDGEHQAAIKAALKSGL